MALVPSPVAHGTLDSVDISEAMKMPGVRAFVDHKDVVEGALIWGDTPVFAKDKV